MILDIIILILFSVIIIPRLKLEEADIDENLSVELTGTLKGILCLAIFFNHFTGWFLQQNPVSYVLVHCGSQAVSVFFFLSAYGLYRKYSNRKLDKTFIFKRIAKLMIPYWICEIIYSLVSVLGKVPIKVDINPRNVLIAALGLVDKSEIVENAWFVTAIAFMYICYYLSSKVFPNIKMSLKLLIIILIFSVITKGKWITSSLVFPLGVFIAESEMKIREQIKRRFWLLLLLFTVLFAMGITLKYVGQYLDKNVLMDFSDVITSILTPIVLFIVLTRIRIGNVITKFLSSISYEFYLLHGLMIRISYSLWGLEKVALFCLTAIALTVIASFAVNKMSSGIQKFCLRG